jgi:hypothetical protein
MRYVLPFFVLSLGAIPIPGTSVSMDPPSGLTTAARFTGFTNADASVSIMVTELPVPVASAAGGLQNSERLAAQRMTVVKKEPVKLASGPADLYLVDQRYAGAEFRKVILVAGNESRTVMVTATCMAEHAATWEPAFRASLLTVKLGAPNPKVTSFVITPMGGLKETPAVSGSLAFSKGGVFPLADQGDPLYLANRSIAPVPVGAVGEFTEKRIRQLPGVENFRVATSKAVEIDGLTGHAVTGTTAEHFIHAVILRDPAGGYYFLLGRVAAAQGAAHQELFQAMSASFRRL